MGKTNLDFLHKTRFCFSLICSMNLENVMLNLSYLLVKYMRKKVQDNWPKKDPPTQKCLKNNF